MFYGRMITDAYTNETEKRSRLKAGRLYKNIADCLQQFFFHNLRKGKINFCKIHDETISWADGVVG